MTHWQRYLPKRYAQISDPASFFQALGEEAAEEIAALAQQLAGQDPPGEIYMDKVGRLNNARQRAEEIVLREKVLLDPEPTADPDTTTQQAAPDDPWQDVLDKHPTQ